MDLSRITVKPRARSNYEAIDLGLIMARSWWKPLFLSWFIPSLICYMLLSLIFFENNWAALLITWWLKPLWDRGPLYIASRKLFNDEVKAGEIISSLPGIYSRDIFAWLLWRRFSLTRSFDMPVTVLEGLNKDKRRKRINILHQNSSSSATWLTIVSVHIEMIVWIGSLGFFMLLVPGELDINLLDSIIDEDVIANLISNTVSFLSMAVIAPFYTMAGFSLYINRRITLEAWDIEIKFRDLAERQTNKLKLSTVLLFMLTCITMTTLPSKSYADSYTTTAPEQSKKLIKEILEGEDFHKQELVKGWRLKEMDEAQQEGAPEWLISFIRFLERWFGDSDTDPEEPTTYTFATLLEILLWLIAISVIAYLLTRTLRYMEVFAAPSRKNNNDRPVAPDALFGLDIREESIPENVAELTMSLWQAGKPREAIGLLYRASLSLLIHQLRFNFYHSYTEQECANIVARSDNISIKDFFIKLTTAWQQIAYAHSTPPEPLIYLLCDQWKEISSYEK